MTKLLSIAAALALAVGCKTDAPAPTNPAADTSNARSAKIDVKPVQPPPALPPADPAPAADPPAAGSPRPERPPGARPGDDQFRGRDMSRRRERLDTNHDGVISDEERAAQMQQRVTSMHARLDADGDGKLTPEELGNAPGRMHFDNPAALDTNHDGDISADELAAALKARAEQRRAAAPADPARTP